MAIALAFGVVLPPAEAQTLKVLYRFTGGADGENPVAGVVRDAAGNLYGTTGCNYCVSGAGSVFKVDKHGRETTLHHFSGGNDGGFPDGGVIRDAEGNLYGTTFGGGAYGFGSVFKIDSSGKFTTLYSFGAYANDAEAPFGGLLLDDSGNLYGTASGGGVYFCGAVFKLDVNGNETLLHSFTGVDGASPFAGLIQDSAHNLYGTTFSGGTYGTGTVFKLDAAGTETVLHSFRQGFLSAVLVRDTAGNLYGAAAGGGHTGNGLVFKVNDTTGRGRLLYSFSGKDDGEEPAAGLVRDAAGNFYGTTFLGGTSGAGTVFKLDRSGKETVLYSFTGGTDGGNPESSLVMDATGNLYGTAYLGGDSSCFSPFGCGVVFELTAQ
jgi:uncharacterized repeat protein (TIGR03803 family)